MAGGCGVWSPYLGGVGAPVVKRPMSFVLSTPARFVADAIVFVHGSIVVSVVCYIATFSFLDLLFHWFTPSGHDYGLNYFHCLQIHSCFCVCYCCPAPKACCLHWLLVCTVHTCATVDSQVRDYECNGLHNHSKAVPIGSLTLGLLATVLSVVYSAVRVGSFASVLSPPESPMISFRK